ncbi:9340_t:CDS:2, partial [Dentiscutata heterogama]
MILLVLTNEKPSLIVLPLHAGTNQVKRGILAYIGSVLRALR